MLNPTLHRKLFIFFICTLTLGITLGKFIMSISIIGLFANWLFEGGFRKKWEINKQRNYGALFLASIFLIELVWFLFAEELKPGLSTLRIKLPFLVMAIVFGTSNAINKREIKTIISCFIIGVVVSSIASYFVELGWINKKTNSGTSRDISIFMSHIRYSIILSFAVILIIFLMVKNKFNKWIGTLVSLFVLFLIYKMASLTAISGLLIGLVILFIYSLKSLSQPFKKGVILSTISVILFFIIKLSLIISDHYQAKESFTVDLNLSKSIYGEKYLKNNHNKMLENGYYVWNNIAPKEIKNAWNKRSKIPFESEDLKGQKIKHTIYRYITSKGLRKDKEGFSKLTENDIKSIESGMTTSIKYNTLEKRVREILFEMDVFRKNKYTDNHSFTQRILFWKIGISIFKKAPFLGHGTGGVETQYKKYYKENAKNLSKKNQLFAHNQFLTQIINLGLFAFVFWISIIIIPIIQLYKTNKELFLIFSSFMSIAFFTDDMLDRQAGVTIFVTIYYLLIYSSEESSLKKLFIIKKKSK